MKQFVNKIRRKASHNAAALPPAERITNETVAEHRERILAGGRKFKYPMQHPKHHIVLITAGIVLAVALAVLALFTWQLYRVQATSRFVYSATVVIPFPVAKVDGATVRYRDYLLELRSSLHYLSTKENINFSTDDGQRQMQYQKRLALNKAEQNAYVAKLARELNVTVTKKEVDAFVVTEINNNRLGVNEKVYAQVIRDYYDWSLGEYKQSITHQLLRKKVAARIDTARKTTADRLLIGLKSGANFDGVAKEFSDDPITKANGGDVGSVPVDADDPNGLIAAAKKLQPGQVSDVIEGVDAFYIITLVDSQEKTLHFKQIRLGYSEFNNRFAALKKDNKITEYIKVVDSVTPTNR